MTESIDSLLNAARQLVETDMLLGGDFMPADRNPLPQPKIPEPTAPPIMKLTKKQKVAALGELKKEVENCTSCQLAATRTQVVFGEGNPAAELVFVGEAPGADEDESGRPFVGRAGQLLTNMIEAMGLSREKDIFICNMLKCRPPNNRAPNPTEIQCCWNFLIKQLQILQPKVIVTLGNPATHGLLQTKVGITKLRGQWQKLPDIGEGLEGIDVMPTFHPSYVLRQYTPDNRKNVWADLQAVMDKLGIKPPKKD